MRVTTTRIMTVDTDTYTVYRSQTEDSERVGTKNVYILHGTVTGQLAPVRDSTSLEIYGNRVEQMYNLLCTKAADLQINDKVKVNGEDYKVIAVMPYTGHFTATIERVGVISGTA